MNLFRGTRSTIEDAVNAWGDEVDLYHSSGYTRETAHLFVDSPNPDLQVLKSSMILNSSNLVWNDTTHVGCSSHACGDAQEQIAIVCHVSPSVVCREIPQLTFRPCNSIIPVS